MTFWQTFLTSLLGGFLTLLLVGFYAVTVVLWRRGWRPWRVDWRAILGLHR